MIRRGQTLIEMIAVVAVLLLMAALILPEFAKAGDRQAQRWFYNNLGQAITYARNQAILQNTITVLSYDPSSKAFTVSGDSAIDPLMPGSGQSSPDTGPVQPESDPNGASTTQNPFATASQQGMEAPPTPIDPSSISKQTAMPDAFSPQTWMLNGQQVDESTWFVRFYPDGTSDRAMVTIAKGDASTTFVINERGRWESMDGDAPDESTLVWPGGSLETRQ